MAPKNPVRIHDPVYLPRCQHENRPQAKFCDECGTPLTANPSALPSRSYAEITSALSEALETRHGITLTQTVDARVADIVADERKVKQILVNLLSNAVKFTPEGGRVGLSATAADGVVTIAVSDTGIGIARRIRPPSSRSSARSGARTLANRRARDSG